MCHDGTGLRGSRAEARLLGVLVKNGPPQTALERRSGRTPTVVILKNRSILADIAVPLLEPGDDQKTRRSGSKSGSGQWSHWDEIGRVHYPEIGWSHSDEIRGVQSLEILQDVGTGIYAANPLVLSPPGGQIYADRRHG